MASSISDITSISAPESQEYITGVSTTFSTPMRALLGRPYWRRIWIIQEIAKAQRVLVLCGGDSIDWHRMLNATRYSNETDKLASFTYNGEDDSHCNLFKALKWTEHCEASDQRDKIYAVLELTSNGSSIVTSPNYLHPPRKIYFQMFEDALAQSDLSHLVQRTEITEDTEGYDVSPDWTSLEMGISKWLASTLQEIFSSDDFGPTNNEEEPPKDGILGRWSLPTANHTHSQCEPSPLLSVTYYGLEAPGRIIDAISYIATPLANIYELPDNDGVSRFSFSETESLSKFALLREKLSTVKNKISTASPTQALGPTEPCINSQPVGDLSIALSLFGRLPLYPKGDDIIWLDTGLMAYMLGALWSNGDWISDGAHPINIHVAQTTLRKWLAANQELRYRDKTIRQWLELYVGSPEYAKDHRAAIKEVKRRQKSGGWMRTDLECNFLKNIAEISRHSEMRFAVGRASVLLGYVGSAAREGDLVFLLRGCRTPIIIRKDRDAYRFISVTCVPHITGAYASAEKNQERRLKPIRGWDKKEAPKHTKLGFSNSTRNASSSSNKEVEVQNDRGLSEGEEVLRII